MTDFAIERADGYQEDLPLDKKTWQSFWKSVIPEYELARCRAELRGDTAPARHLFLREKFVRYAHNLNLDKCKKYHQKMMEFELQEMENPSDNKVTIIRRGWDPEDTVTAEDEYAVIQLSNMFKRHYDTRVRLLELIPFVS